MRSHETLRRRVFEHTQNVAAGLAYVLGRANLLVSHLSPAYAHGEQFYDSAGASPSTPGDVRAQKRSCKCTAIPSSWLLTLVMPLHITPISSGTEVFPTAAFTPTL